MLFPFPYFDRRHRSARVAEPLDLVFDGKRTPAFAAADVTLLKRGAARLRGCFDTNGTHARKSSFKGKPRLCRAPMPESTRPGKRRFRLSPQRVPLTKDIGAQVQTRDKPIPRHSQSRHRLTRNRWRHADVPGVGQRRQKQRLVTAACRSKPGLKAASLSGMDDVMTKSAHTRKLVKIQASVN
ncbi:hypothetical protein [uncultured Agrobacterium sp.]|uniref:hypothetical protein n=1 Tax=uncultured Agrobacterium sp. TaxID=157277 RepID=UPI0025D88EBA|nr:hypothetical protein [uncultured Agrobacterium sp.]